MIRRPIALFFVVFPALPFFLSPAFPQQSVETQFLAGLQNRGFYDLAEKHLKKLMSQPGLAAASKGDLHYTAATMYMSWAEAVVSDPAVPPSERLSRKEAYLKESMNHNVQALKLAPKDPRALESHFAIGRVYKEQAMNTKRLVDAKAKELAKLGPAPDPKKATAQQKAKEAKVAPQRAKLQKELDALKAKAISFLNKSIAKLRKMASERDKQTKALRKQITGTQNADRLGQLKEQEDKLRKEMVLAKFEWYQNLMYLGELQGIATEAGKKSLAEAVKQIKALRTTYKDWMIAKYALVIEGYCYHLLKNYPQAYKRYDENIKLEDTDQFGDVIQKSYFRKAKSAAAARNYPLVVYTLEGAKYEVTRDDVRAKDKTKRKTLDTLAKQFGADAKYVMNLNGKTTKELKAGEKVVMHRGLFERFEGLDATEIGMAAKIELAEAYVSWAKLLKAQRKHQREWMGKFTRGITYAEEVAGGTGAWSSRANQLLAEWSKALAAYDVVTPAQLYAEGTDAYFKAAAKPKGTAERRQLFEHAIRTFQRVIAYWDPTHRQSTSNVSDEKVLDVWNRIGTAYYQTGRLQEAAFAWNAGALYFPESELGTKSAYFSTAAAQKAYKAAGSREERIRQGYLYESMLRDFIQNFPDHPKAADSQFMLAEVLRYRKDHLGAAAEYARVPQVSQFYEQSLYFKGASYQNHYYALYNEGKGDSNEGKEYLLKAASEMQAYIDWVEKSESPDKETLSRRKEWQAKSVYRRATIFLFPVVESADEVLKTTTNFVERFDPYLSPKTKASLYPKIYFTRLKAEVLKQNSKGAEAMLKELLKSPKFKDLADAFKQVAQIYTQKAEELAKKIEELKSAKKNQEAEAADKEAPALRNRAAELYASLIDRAPEQDSSIYLFVGHTFYAAREFEKAAKYYPLYLSRFSNDSSQKENVLQVKFQFAESLFRIKQFQKALPILEEMELYYKRQNDPKRYLVKPFLGHTLNELGRHDEALKQWGFLKNSFQAGTDDWWTASYEIGRTLLLKKDLNQCVTFLKTTALLYPKMGGKLFKPKFVSLLNDLKGQVKNNPAHLSQVNQLLDRLK